MMTDRVLLAAVVATLVSVTWWMIALIWVSHDCPWKSAWRRLFHPSISVRDLDALKQELGLMVTWSGSSKDSLPLLADAGRILWKQLCSPVEIQRLAMIAIHAPKDVDRMWASGELRMMDMVKTTEAINGLLNHASLDETKIARAERLLTEVQNAAGNQALPHSGVSDPSTAQLEQRNLLSGGQPVKHSGDTYHIGSIGTATNVGPNAHLHNMTVQQVANQAPAAVNLSELLPELELLRQQMRKESTTPEHDMALGAIAAAEKAAKEGDESKVMQHLRSAGKWAFEMASRIGAAVAAYAIKQAIGL